MLLVRHCTAKLEDHSFLAVHDCSCSIFTAVLHIWRPRLSVPIFSLKIWCAIVTNFLTGKHGQTYKCCPIFVVLCQKQNLEANCGTTLSEKCRLLRKVTVMGTSRYRWSEGLPVWLVVFTEMNYCDITLHDTENLEWQTEGNENIL